MVPARALAYLHDTGCGYRIPSLSGGPVVGPDKAAQRWMKQYFISETLVPSGREFLSDIRRVGCDTRISVVACDSIMSFVELMAKRLEIPVADYLLAHVAYNLWNGEGCKPLVKPATAFHRFEAALKEDMRREKQAEREAARLEPLTIVISDQQELQRIYALAGIQKANPVPFIRRHLRQFVRKELETHKLETSAS